MKTYRSLTFKYLLKQKKRTLLTILGVVLSIALITAVGTMILTIEAQTVDDAKKENGYYHASFKSLPKEQANILKSHTRLEKTGLSIGAGYARPLENAYIKLIGCDSDYLEIKYVTLLEGRAPEKENEIVLEKWILQEMGKKTGDSVTLEVKDRNDKEIADEAINKNGTEASNTAASAPVLAKREFTITGVLKDDPYSIAISASKGFIPLKTAEGIREESVLYDSLIRIREGLPIQQNLKDIITKLGLAEDKVEYNTRLLILLGQSSNEDMNDTMYGIVAFLVTLIIIATAAVIYNSFHISVLERIRQFGVLRSIGTTPGQIRKIVIGEAMVIAAVSLPLGLAGGVVAVKTVVWLFNLSQYSLLAGHSVVVSPRVLAVSSFVGFISVFLSALSPAFLAGRVSPIQAILDNKKGPLKESAILAHGRMYRFLRKVTGIEGAIAFKNLKRNKKRFRVTVFSMSIGITVFLVFNTFATYIFEGMHGRDSYYGDFIIGFNQAAVMGESKGYTLKDYEDIMKIPGIQKVYRKTEVTVMATFQHSRLSEDYINILKVNGQNIPEKLEGSEFMKPESGSKLWGYDRNMLMDAKQHLSSGTIDEDVLTGEKGVVIVQNTEVRNNVDGKSSVIRISDLKVGDYVYIDTGSALAQGQKAVEGLHKVKVSGILEKVPFGFPYPGSAVGIITSQPVFEQLTGIDIYNGFDILIDKNADKKAIKEKLTEISGRVRGGSVLDLKAMSESQSQMRLTISVLLYGFVSVIALIGVLNIINTISTNLILRTREFGTLRAVGMTMGQMKKMITLEGLLYGINGSIWGIAVGTIMAYALFRLMTGLRGMIWYMPYEAIIIACAGTIIITLLSTLVPMKRVSSMNIIESVGVEE